MTEVTLGSRPDTTDGAGLGAVANDGIGAGAEARAGAGAGPGVRADPGRAWANPNFRRLWTASAASTFGVQITEIALPLLAVVTLSATAQQVGLLRTAQFLPFLLATLPLGVLVDRKRGRRLRFMVGADLGRFVLVGAIPVAVWCGVTDIEVLYVAVFAAGVLTVLYSLADFALLPSIVPQEQLVDANGKITGTQAANEMGGRGLGGVLVQAVSAPGAIAVNAVTYLVSALCLRRIRLAGPDGPGAPAAPPVERGGPSWSDTVEGVQIAVRHRYIRPLLGEASTFNAFYEMFLLGLMLHAVRHLGMNAAEIGLVFTGSGAGTLVGAWFGARVTARFGYGRVLLATLVLGNTVPVAVAFAGHFGAALLPLLCTVFVIMGLGIGVADVHAVSLRQVAVPEDLRGRVNGAYRLVSWGCIPLGASVGGYVAARAGSQATMTIGAVGIALASLWVAFSSIPRLRRIDDAAVDAAVPDPAAAGALPADATG